MSFVKKNLNWKPYDVIYSAGDDPDGVYLIKEGKVDLYTPEGLKLNEIGDNEIFGESSIILGTKRTVTAKAAIIKKTQLRLLDSNNQSQDLSNEIEKLANLIEKTKSDTKKVDKIIKGIKTKLSANKYMD